MRIPDDFNTPLEGNKFPERKLADSSLGRVPGRGAIPQSKSQYKRLTAQGAPMPDYCDLARRLLEALEICKKELRYYPGDTNREGDALIDAAFSLAESLIAEAREKLK